MRFRRVISSVCAMALAFGMTAAPAAESGVRLFPPISADAVVTGVGLTFESNCIYVQSPWETTYFYGWGSGSGEPCCGEYPGTEMTSLGDGLFSIPYPEIPVGDSAVYFIFSDGIDRQTAEINDTETDALGCVYILSSEDLNETGSLVPSSTPRSEYTPPAAPDHYPAPPKVTEAVLGGSDYNKVRLEIPAKEINGRSLDKDKLFYRLYYVKGGVPQLLTFRTIHYGSLSADTTEIPYGYNDYFDIYERGSLVYLNQSDVSGWTDIGVMSVYRTDGRTFETEIEWYNPDPADAEYTYTRSGGKVTVTGYKGKGGDVVIPSVIKYEPVAVVGRGAFSLCGSLKSVVIPDSAESVADNAFLNCSALAKVTIPAGVTAIGDGAFGNCTAISDVYYSGTMAQWEKIAFGSENGYLRSALIHCTDGTLNVHVHSYKSTVTRPATCTEDGLMTYTCECGDSYTETIPATGHKFVNKRVAPTYDEQGYTEHTCSECGYSYKDNYSPKKERTDISKATVKANNKAYTGKALKPSVTVTLDGKTLKKGTDFTVSYKNNLKCGKGTATVTGKGAYKGTKSGSFIVKPSQATASKLTSPKAKAVKLTWKKSAGGVTGYQVQVALDKSFKKSAKIYTIAKATATSKTVTKLKSGKKYYVRVRAYKTVGKTKYSGKWSKIKSVKCK